MNPDISVFPFRAMGSANEIQLYGQNAGISREIAGHIIADVKALEQRFSRYLPDSIVSRINDAAGKEAVEVDPETAALLDYADSCYRQSGGLFDITSGVLRRAWDFNSGRLPSKAQIDELLPLIGWNKAEWKKPFFRLPVKGMQIDFGGIGKEYAADRAAGLLMQSGAVHALLNFGGDIRITGPHPDGSPWSIGIKHPREEGGIISTVRLGSGAVATSGDYEKFMTVEGKRYCHILNPRTGFPSNGFQSVTVISASCLVAGSIATIAMLHPEDKAEKFLKEVGENFVAVSSDGYVRTFRSGE